MADGVLTIRLTRKADGAIVFELRRPDGTTTWQKRAGPAAEFFAVHDLTHYAVESELGFERAFYGLVAEGWDLTDFGTPWPRGPLPPEALPAELIVGYLDTARASHEPLSAEACNEAAARYFEGARIPAHVAVSEDALARVRERLAALVWQWHALPPRESLELSFPAPRAVR